MTNKRKHQLERKVRINFINFNQIIYPKEVGIKFLEQITTLTIKSVWYEYYRGNISISEAYFMAHCTRIYYWHYKALIDKNFE